MTALCAALSVFFTVSLIALPAAAAVEPPPLPPTATAGPNLKAAETDAVTFDRLAAKADRVGSLSVIIGLDVDAVAEGRLQAAQRADQRQRIQTAAASLQTELRGFGVSGFHAFAEIPYAVARVDAAGLRALQHSRHVIGVSENESLGIDDGPSTPSQNPVETGVSNNQDLANWWNLGRIQQPLATNKGYDGRGQTVAILDTGVARNHDVFTGRVIREACYSGYRVRTSGSCPGGYTAGTGTGSAAPCTYHASCAHGTHVAGTAAGASGVGVAGRAKIIAVNVFHRTSVGPKSYTSDQLWGMKYVYDQRGSLSIAAVNLSIGDGSYGTYCDDRTSTSSFYAWARTLRSVGIATVVSSGNDSSSTGISSPSCNSNVVSVGNTTLNSAGRDAVFVTSNSDDILWLLAPGTRVCSSVPGNDYDCWNGTSMAAPHVAGAFALLKQLERGTSVKASLNALVQTGTPVYDSRNGVTRGRINLWDALVYAYNH